MEEPTERELRELGTDLARFRRLSAPPRLRQGLRASLLAAPPRRTTPRLLGWLRLPVLRPIVAFGLALALVGAGGGSAAASSVPGDPAFGLKRAVEEIQVALAPDGAARLQLLLGQSDRRLAELRSVAGARPGAIAPATDEYRAAIARVDAALVTLLATPSTPFIEDAIVRASAASADHVAELESLASRLPDAAQPGIERAIEAQRAVHGRSESTPGERGNRGAAPEGRSSAAPARTAVPAPGGRSPSASGRVPSPAPTASAPPSVSPSAHRELGGSDAAPSGRGGLPSDAPGRRD